MLDFLANFIVQQINLHRILLNILYNSLKFTKTGSIKLSVNIEKDTSDETTVLFEIVDTGIGMKPEVVANAFVAYLQADSSVARKYGGTGLGLSISKSFVEFMGGEIGASSKYGNGTKVWFRIPFAKVTEEERDSLVSGSFSSIEYGIGNNDRSYDLCNSDSEKSETESNVRPTISFTRQRSKEEATTALARSDNIPEEVVKRERKNSRILVVEDNLINQKIAKKTLANMGFSVLTAENGKECLDCIQKDEPPDLILMDCQMPILDGYAATSLLRHHPSDAVRKVPIVAMTASVIVGDREKCLAVGMNDYLPKPFKVKDLENIIMKWLVQRRDSGLYDDDMPMSSQVSPQNDANLLHNKEPKISSESFNPFKSAEIIDALASEAVDKISSLEFIDLVATPVGPSEGCISNRTDTKFDK